MSKTALTVLLSVCAMCLTPEVAAQQDTFPQLDTNHYHHLPRKALLWSILPGAGQVYNEIGYRKVVQKKHRSWWKAPIIYAGLGICTYYWHNNYSRARMLKEEILYRRENGDTTVLHEQLNHYTSESALINGYVSTSGTQIGFNERARRRALFFLATIGVYGLNMIEAFVDAHFVTFDISEDLSLSCYPTLLTPSTPGVSLRLCFD